MERKIASSWNDWPSSSHPLSDGFAPGFVLGFATGFALGSASGFVPPIWEVAANGSRSRFRRPSVADIYRGKRPKSPILPFRRLPPGHGIAPPPSASPCLC